MTGTPYLKLELSFVNRPSPFWIYFRVHLKMKTLRGVKLTSFVIAVAFIKSFFSRNAVMRNCGSSKLKKLIANEMRRDLSQKFCKLSNVFPICLIVADNFTNDNFLQLRKDASIC